MSFSLCGTFYLFNYYAEATKKLAVDAGARIERDNETSVQVLKNVCKKYLTAVTDNIELRFSDDVSQLIGALQSLLKDKEEATASDFQQLEEVTGLSAADLSAEWCILRRMPGEQHSQEKLTDLALSAEKQVMFPAFSVAARILLYTSTPWHSFS